MEITYIVEVVFINASNPYCIITAPVVPTACLRVWYTEYAFTRSVYPLAYASGALLKH